MSANRLGFAALIFAGGSCYLTPPPSYPTGTAPEAQVAEPPPHQPQPQESWEPTEPGTTIDVDQIPPEEAAPEVEVFYDSLAPYGLWNDDAEWGRVWIPSDASYRPYQRGYWQPTDYGFTWIAEEPFGWAVCHYGRWFVWNGRWAWKPDTVWGPAWVEWREADGYLGW